MKKKVLALLLAGVMLAGYLPQMASAPTEVAAAETTEEAEYPYLDTSLSFEERAADLVSRMTLEEKALQLITTSAAAIPRLGVSKYNYWSEGLHGVARSGEATSYPHGLGIASTWNEEMVELMGQYIADEARGYSNGRGKGLSYWNPTINLARDPRWGRAEEGYGEDPYLTSALAQNVVNGMQGDDEKYLQTIATLKHFVANNSEFNRHNGSSDMDERDLREYYSYTFKNVVENTDVASVMSSYNQVNGVPMSANEFILTDMLRNTWGFTGYVTSDCGAILDIFRNHKWQPEGYDHTVNSVEATALAIAAGCDINCGSVYHVNAVQAVEQGLLSEDDIDKALIRLFTARMKTGEFDPAEMVPYRSEEYSFANQVEAEPHKQLAEDMADEAIILLKNEDGALPLSGEQKNIVVVGQLAEMCIQGDYSADPSDENRSTPIEGIRAAAARAGEDVNVTYINHYGNKDVASYLLNVKGFEFNYDTVKKTMPANQADAFQSCIVENNGTQNFGYISSGAYALYEDVDMNGMTSFGVQAAGAAADAYASTVELHLDSPDGEVIATVEPSYTSGWQTYETATVDLEKEVSGVHDLYITMDYRLSDIAFSAEEEKIIAEADAVIVYAGTRTIDGEGALGNAAADSAEERDRETLDFPRNQAGTILEVAGLNENTIVCIQAVGQMNVEPFKDEVKAITWSTYNGQAQGNAIGRILYGEKNPSARLTFSWYTSLYQLDYIGSYDLRGQNNTNGRTYQYFDGDISYPFGHGLSYTDFAYSNMQIDKTDVTTNDQIQVSVDVTNTGSAAGQEVVQMYVVSPDAEENDRPAKRLQGFDKVMLEAGETKTVTMTLETEGLEYWSDEENRFDYDLGTYEIQISTSAADADIMAAKSFDMNEKAVPQLKTVTITGKQTFDEGDIGEPVETEVTAALRDDSFVELTDEMVAYTSSNEAVASVDENGLVTPISNGTAVITATVTVDGVTLEDSYSIAVSESPESAKLNLYYIGSKADTNLVLAVDGGNTAAGTQLIEWENNGGTDQQWRMVEAEEEGYYYFVDNKSGHYMSVQNKAEDSIIIQAEKDLSDDKQLWLLEESDEEGFYYIVNAASGYAMTRGPVVPNAVPISPLIQSEIGATEEEDQLWNLQPLVEQVTVEASAKEGGSIDPAGTVAVVKGGNKVFKFTPDEGYEVEDVLVNGESVGAVNYYTFKKLESDATIEVSFKEVKTEKPILPYVDVTKDNWFYDAVYYNYIEETMTGMDPTHFGPYGQLSRAQFALILYRIENEPEFDTKKSFADITGDEWYGKAVLWAAEAGIVNGYQDGSFGPVDNITREQMALMMYRYANYLKENTETKADISKFTDAAQVSGFAVDAIKWANGMGIITGKENGTIIDPQGNTARAEAAAIIQRFMDAYTEK